MDFSLSQSAQEYLRRMQDFMGNEVLPAETEWHEYLRVHGPHEHPPVMERLKDSAQRKGLWNLFLQKYGGLSNVDYAPIAEESGWSPVIAPEALNCQAPDTGNMEVLERFGTPPQKREWLQPLLDGDIRSAFAMTEPDVAASDATNIATRIDKVGGDYVLNGRKWWITGVADARCRVFLVMGVSNPDASSPHERHSIVLVPRDTEGIEVVRHLPIFGYQDQHGHSEIKFNDVRVPADALLGSEGQGFKIAQARLGSGRIHHAMRAVGMAERALSLMVDRAKIRTAFGVPLADQSAVQQMIARSRIEIDQVRLYVLHTAWQVDQVGSAIAAGAIAGIKVAAPAVAVNVVDRAIEVFGAAGLGDDTPLAYLYAWARALRVVDGPDAVHQRTIARIELRRTNGPIGERV